MRSSKRLVLSAAIAAVAPVLATSSHAANIVWDGGGTESSVLSAANWVGDVLPGLADSAHFTGSVRLDPFVPAAGVQYNSLFFLAGATGPFTIAGPGTITLGANTAGNYLNNDTVDVGHTINANVNLIGGTINATQGNLTFGGTLNIGNNLNDVAGHNVALNANGNATTGVYRTINLTTIAGTGTATSAGGALNKNGLGNLNVTGNNAAWGGNVFINGGNLRITNANALGSGAGGDRIETALTSGGTGLGTLELAGGDYTLNKLVTTRARQAATINEVAIRNVEGNHTIATVATGSGGTQFNYESAAGNLSIQNWNTTATGGSRILRLLGAGNGEMVNWNPASGTTLNLIKDGTGTWDLRAGFGNASVTIAPVFSPVTVNGGTLRIDGANPTLVTGTTTVNSGGTLIYDGGYGQNVRGNTVVNSGGTLRIVSPGSGIGEVGNAATPTSITVQSTGVIDASTFSNYSLQIGQTLINGGTFNTPRLDTYGDNAIYTGNTNGASVGTAIYTGDLAISNAFASAGGGLYFDLAATNTVGGGVNDLIQVGGNLIVDNSGGQIRLRVNPLTGSLQTGTYTLITASTASSLNASDFVITGLTAGATRQQFNIVTAPGQVNLAVTGAPASLVWTGAQSASWETATNNWLNGASADKYYQFDNVTFNDNSTVRTVDVSSSVTPTGMTVTTNNTYQFNGAGGITTINGLTKNGTGTLILNNGGDPAVAESVVNNFVGGVTINAGTLQVGTGGAEGSLGTGVPITNNGTLVYNTSSPRAPGIISGTGNLIVRGPSGITLNAAHTYTGTTTLEAGSTTISNANGLGDVSAGTTILAGAQLYSVVQQTIAEPFTINGNAGGGDGGAIRAGGATTSTFTGPVTLGSSSTISTDGGATAIFNAPITGTGDLTKVGPGTMVIGANGNNYSGSTTVMAGTLQVGVVGTAGDLPAGALNLNIGSTLAFGSDQALTFSRPINVINPNAATGTATIAQGSNGGTTTLTGDLSGFTGTLAALGLPAQPLQPPAVHSGTLVVATPTGATTVTIADNGSGNGAGIVRLAHSSAIAPTATISVNAQQDRGIGRLELSNNVSVTAGAINLAQRNLFAGLTINDVTPAIQSHSGSNTLTGPIVLQTGGTYAGLSAAAGATLTVEGTVAPLAGAGTARNLVLQGAGTGVLNSLVSNNAANDRALNLNKIGSGTWTVNGANTYTGTNLITAGTLVFGVNAQTPVLSGANGIDVQGGKVAFKYSGSSAALVSQIHSTLDAGYDQTTKFATGQIRSTTIANNRILGWRDNIAQSQVEVAYTLAGDTNLDYLVNFGDLLTLAQNYGVTSGKTWSQGDFNYDNGVNFADLLLLAQNYGTSLTAVEADQVGASFAADYALALSMVPEPASLSLLGFGALALTRRRRA